MFKAGRSNQIKKGKPMEQYRKQIATLKAEKRKLEIENTTLRTKNADLEKRINQLADKRHLKYKVSIYELCDECRYEFESEYSAICRDCSNDEPNFKEK